MMIVDDDACMRCGACVGTCPANAMFLKETGLEVGDDCTKCGLCVRACPVGALELEGDAS